MRRFTGNPVCGTTQMSHDAEGVDRGATHSVGRDWDGRVAALAQCFRLWFSSWGTDQSVAVDLDGNSEVMGRGGGDTGWALDWLPDGRMLVTGGELIRVEPDGEVFVIEAMAACQLTRLRRERKRFSGS